MLLRYTIVGFGRQKLLRYTILGFGRQKLLRYTILGFSMPSLPLHQFKGRTTTVT